MDVESSNKPKATGGRRKKSRAKRRHVAKAKIDEVTNSENEDSE